MEEIEIKGNNRNRNKTQIKGINKIIIETIEYDSSKLISDLNFQKELIKKIKDIETKFKKLKIYLKKYWYNLKNTF